MSRNDEVARRLETFADLLEAQDVSYKPRTYRRAAENVRDYPEDIADLAADGKEAVAEIDGVGDAISAKIVEYVETGEIEELTELQAEMPVEMDALTRVEGVGPKTVGTLYEELGVQTLDDLESAARAGEIQEVPGFGPKTEQNILDGIDFARTAHERQLLDRARPRGERVRDALLETEAVERCELAGSIRRWKPTVGDVDVLVGSDQPEAVIEAFQSLDIADTVIEAGTSKASLRTEGVRVDLRVVDDEEFGAALQYFTGSKQHNVAVRNRALDRDQKVNEYGVFDISEVADPDSGQRVGERVAGVDEEGMYDALGMEWVPPELREDRGEVERAAAGDLPDLLEQSQLRGDLHMHSEWSDGGNSITELVDAAAEFGHEYIAVTDHASGPGILSGVGLDDDELYEQIERIEAVAAEAEIEVFAGVEANIEADGGISVGDDVLEALDLVVASPHSGLDGEGTERLAEAARHPEVDVLGHPSGRRLNQRAGLDLDVERLAAVAAEHGTALEINSTPGRLDLPGRAVKQALDAGATVVIDTDAHEPSSFEYIRYGAHTARRGWAEAEDVLNTRPAEEIQAFVQ
ncbi:DNA polymerase/3'-5' exonuclease PolX [Halovenus sp. WSH3]|uniref:DNA polymerase beta n=1 Tax=Halovenus carboxidivorans TaxID=2692199 RepID=A0A6B0SYD4_9EURY|nr:DNA polymerase/3'-5' exonuclease PolX [Halovenus carboxidivorans]MXR50574.1 DNA polymerase/3'-5' exonuclease PolX [Halovenus carboxidivorans]